MDIWLVIDRYDHSETVTTAHLTLKGALIQAWGLLLESQESSTTLYSSVTKLSQN